MNKLDESESLATPASVNGIGSTTFPTATSSGSGDLPLSLNRKSKVFKRFKEFVLIPRVNESSETYDDYPKGATDNAKLALRWRDKYGREEVQGGTEVGWARANQLAKREKISEETVNRMAAFNRHRKNSKVAEEFKETPWKDRGYIAWLIWGGTEGIDWAIKKAEELRKRN